MNCALRTFAVACACFAAGTASATTLTPGSTLGSSSAMLQSRLTSSVNSALGAGTQTISRPLSTLRPVTPVPEPSTWALVFAGLGLVGGVLQVRRSRRG